jgi:hypothetical protein
MADRHRTPPVVEEDPLAPPHPEEHPERHEHSDVSIRGLTIFFIAFVAVAVLVHVGLWILFDVYEGREQALDVTRQQSAIASPLPRVPAEGVWPEGVPRLQGVAGYHGNTPAQDMAELRVLEQRKLRPAQPSLNPDGTARIPIDRAMQIIVQNRLLQTAPPATQPAPGGDQHDTAAPH